MFHSAPNTQHALILAALFALALPACGDMATTDSLDAPAASVAAVPECAGQTCADDVETRAAALVESAEIVSIEFAQGPQAHLLHSLSAAVELAVDAEPFTSEVTFGLRAGQDVCTFASASLQHSGGQAIVRAGATATIPNTCAALVGRDDVRLVAALDTDGKLDWSDRGALDGQMSWGERVAASEVKPALSCIACDAGVALSESPGLDAKLRSLSLDSAVVTVPINQDALSDAQFNADIPHTVSDNVPSTLPHLMVQTQVEVGGLALGQALEAQTHLTYAIRPSADGANYDTLSAEARAWASLERETRDGDLKQRLLRDPVSSVSAGIATQKASPLYLPDAVMVRVAEGDWKDTYQFDVQVCVEAGFDEIVIRDGLTVVNNNCATIPVTLLREYYSGGKPAANTSGRQATAATDTWTRKVSYNSGSDTEEDNGKVAVKLYSQHGVFSGQSATTSAGVGSGGTQGVWHEHGAFVRLVYENMGITLGNANSTVVARESGDKVDIELTMMGVTFLDVANNGLVAGSKSSWFDLGIDQSEAMHIEGFALLGYDRLELLGVQTSIDVQGMVGFNVYASNFKYTRTTSNSTDSCSDGVTNTVDGTKLCFYASSMSNYRNTDVDSACDATGGFPAPMRNASDHAAIQTALDQASPFPASMTSAWTGVHATNSTNVYSKFAPDLGLGTTAGSSGGTYTTNVSYTPSMALVSGKVAVDLSGNMDLYSAATAVTHNYVMCARRADTVDTRIKAEASVVPFVSGGLAAGIHGNSFFHNQLGYTSTSSISIVGEIDMLSLEAPLNSEIEAYFPTGSGRPYGTANLDYDADLETLSGRIKFELGPYSQTLVDWDGINLGSWSIYNNDYPIAFD